MPARESRPYQKDGGGGAGRGTPTPKPEPVVPAPTPILVTPPPAVTTPPISPPVIPPPPPPAPPVVPHEVALYYYPPAAAPPTTSQGIVNEIADALQPPPPQITRAYADRLVDAAAYLGLKTFDLKPQDYSPPDALFSIPASPPPPPPSAPTGMAENYIPTILVPTIWVNDTYERNKALYSTARIFELMERVHAFASRATSAGLLPPDDPFLAIAALNKQRPGAFNTLNIDQKTADDILYSIRVYINLLEADNQVSGIDFNDKQKMLSQLSHVNISFDGLGGSGNPATDIMQFLPDGDAVKRKNAIDALSVIDFSKRVPHLLFTLDYVPDPKKHAQGAIIGWRKIQDAAGYIIKRRDVFSGREVSWSIDNKTAKSQSDMYLSYAKLFATSYMNSLDDRSTMVFLDTDVNSEEYYIYRIQAYQTRSELKGSVFSVASSPVYYTPVLAGALNNLLATMDNGLSNISPWPALAQLVMKDASMDWVMAAANIRSSISRGDARDVTRKYSYLSATKEFLVSQASTGKLVKPTKAEDVRQNIENSIQMYGVNQTIQSLLDDTGISYFFEGRDLTEDTHFDRAGTETPKTNNLFQMVGAAIDPATAMVDVRSLSSNMLQLLERALVSPGLTLQPGAAGSTNVSPHEINVPDPELAGDTTAANETGEFQFMSSLGKLKDPFIDLTTFDGISKLMRIIRLFSDFGPDRTTGNQTTAAAPTLQNTGTNLPPSTPSDEDDEEETAWHNRWAQRRGALAQALVGQLLNQPSMYLNSTTAGVSNTATTSLPPETRDDET